MTVQFQGAFLSGRAKGVEQRLELNEHLERKKSALLASRQAYAAECFSYTVKPDEFVGVVVTDEDAIPYQELYEVFRSVSAFLDQHSPGDESEEEESLVLDTVGAALNALFDRLRRQSYRQAKANARII